MNDAKVVNGKGALINDTQNSVGAEGSVSALIYETCELANEYGKLQVALSIIKANEGMVVEHKTTIIEYINDSMTAITLRQCDIECKLGV